jgi:hypothetical protein
VITTNNGFSYRPDDHTNATGTATIASFNSNQFDLAGVIERNTDQDLFKFIMPAEGHFQLNATPYNVGTGNAGSDLDMQVTLMNSSLTVLNVYNPGTLLSSVIDSNLNGGTYYLRIEGKGNAFAPAYASLGSYSLRGSFTSDGTLPLHKLELKASHNGDNHKLNWEIVADEQITDLVVEMSTDGRNFETLTRADNAATQYMYRPMVSSTVYYRLNVTFDDNRQYYSNIVALRKLNDGARPELLGNLVAGSAIQVNSPSKMNYFLTDMNGRTIMRGVLTTGMNSLDASRLVNGIYIIRFVDNDQQWTEKLIRQ